MLKRLICPRRAVLPRRLERMQGVRAGSARHLWGGAGLCAGIACAASAGGDKPTPQLLDHAINVQPVRIAVAAGRDGQIVKVGEWLDYRGGVSRFLADRVFDCFGDADSDGYMDDTGGCGQGAGRWYFGTSYCNGLATNDMRNIHGGSSGYLRADFGWYWTCAGFGSERCIVFIFTQESIPCEPDSFDYSGWLLDFGSLTCNPGAYYYSNVDIGTDGSWTPVSGGDGSYIMGFAQDVTTGGALILATCAQPMLWGDGVDDGGAVANPRGEQETEQLDDASPAPDGFHTTSECYTYNLGLCPDPLGAMLQFWGYPCSSGCDYVDCSSDGIIDTRDVICFLNIWNAGAAAADCNDDTVIDTRDVLCFLNLWNACLGGC